MKWNVPKRKQGRLIIDTDAKNEADDQFAIVHALLSPSFEIRGIVPAHFGAGRTDRSLQESHDEVMLLLKLMGMHEQRVEDGAPGPLPDEQTPVPSKGAALIIEEALSDDPRTLHILSIGPLTDVASALLLEPRIAERDVRLVWLGGGAWPDGGWEFNLHNDRQAANVIFRSSIKVAQVPLNAFAQMRVGCAELFERVHPHGLIGKYLVEQLVRHYQALGGNRSWEFVVICDSAAVGVTLHASAGEWQWRPAPEFTQKLSHDHTGANREIRVYSSIDSRLVFEDFFAKIAQFARKEPGMGE